MIKKIQIINFESHKDTTIEFSETFNVIIGDSDGGKSSIIRAISAVCYNRWSPDMMRVGEDECRITLTTGKGIVTLIKNFKEKINAYEIISFSDPKGEKIKFETIGTSVPEQVYNITEMRELELGDTKDIPNIMYQLEKHYMLAEINGKSCTSNLIARVFDKVIGLGGMEDLISEISSSMLVNKKQITKNNEKIDILRQKIHNESDIEQKEKCIDESSKLFNKIKQTQSFLKRISFYDEEINKLRSRWKLIDNRIINFESDYAKEILNKINSMSSTYNSISNIYNLYINKKKLQEQLTLNIENIKIINQQEIDNLKRRCNTLYKMDKLISKYEEKIALSNQLQVNIKKLEKEHNFLSLELEEIKIKNKICPLCGNTFKECGDKK